MGGRPFSCHFTLNEPVTDAASVYVLMFMLDVSVVNVSFTWKTNVAPWSRGLNVWKTLMKIVCPAGTSTGPELTVNGQIVSQFPLTFTFTSTGYELGLVTGTVKFCVSLLFATNRLCSQVTVPMSGAGITVIVCEVWLEAPDESVTVRVTVKVHGVV